MTGAAITLRGVTKGFRMRAIPGQLTLKSVLIDSFRRRPSRGPERYEALRGVDLSVWQGRSVGIIGENGSGKSTLLRIIAKIYRPDSGSVEVNGRLTALIELGAGFHPEFTGRENIVINGMMLGFSRRRILHRLDEIVAFADLGDFIDQPARTYSSGMFVRLGFSVAVHLDPEILLIDEVLGVGDEAFQKKCSERIADFRRRGNTMVLVTHDLAAVKRWCDDAAWLDRGMVRVVGPPSTVIEAYRHALADTEASRAGVTPGPASDGHEHGSPPAVEIIGSG